MAASANLPRVAGPKRQVLALAADAVAVIVFAAVGRRSHQEDNGVGAVVTTATPFLIALLSGWVVVVGLGRTRKHLRDPSSRGAGVIVVAIAFGAGMVMRRVLWNRGTAPAFVIVAAAFLGLTMLGWRAVAARWPARGK